MKTKPKFDFGTTVITSGANDLLSSDEIIELLEKHGQLDKGLLCSEDHRVNKDALKNGERILSVFTVRDKKFYVITEWDRSVTTILLPEEY